VKKICCLLLLTGAIVLLAGCGGAKEEPVGAETLDLTVAAAASVQDVAKELKRVYGEKNSGVVITYNFASSGTLQKQIEEGAPVDLFISAGKSQMDALEEKGLILPGTRKNLLGNDLVLIAGKDSGLASFDELDDQTTEKISIGTPETAPAGRYAKEALISLGLWEKIQPKLVLAKDVRQVLTYVETGNVDTCSGNGRYPFCSLLTMKMMPGI